MRESIVSSADSTRKLVIRLAVRLEGERRTACVDAGTERSFCRDGDGGDGGDWEDETEGGFGVVVVTVSASSTCLNCSPACLFAIGFARFPPKSMLPLFENSILVGEAKSSRPPVGMKVSMPRNGS